MIRKLQAALGVVIGVIISAGLYRLSAAEGSQSPLGLALFASAPVLHLFRGRLLKKMYENHSKLIREGGAMELDAARMQYRLTRLYTRRWSAPVLAALGLAYFALNAGR